MVHVKSEKEIDLIRESCRIVKDTLDFVGTKHMSAAAALFLYSLLPQFRFWRLTTKTPKVAFPSGEGGFPRKRLRCSGKDGRGPCRWDSIYRDRSTRHNVRGPLPTRCAGHLPLQGEGFWRPHR